MSSLTENTIKQVALGYLKSYYRLRPRAERAPTVTGTDMRGEGGIIADGFLSFLQPDNTNFTATFEATSHQTRQEIRYRPRISHVLWDAAVVTLYSMILLLAVLHIADVYVMKLYGFWPSALMAIAYMATGIILLRYAIGRLPRYRYIYAVEQFKQYHADDQWVAFGYDVFSPEEEKYRRELLRQCTRYGFGLIEIDARRQALLVMAPSRAENFAPRQSLVRLLPAGQWRDRLSNAAKGPWQRLRGRLQKLFTPYQAHYNRWFPKSYPHQWTLLLIGLVGLSYFVAQEYRSLPFVYANTKSHNRALAEQARNERTEPEYFKVDAPEPGFTDTNFTPFVIPTIEEQFSDIIQHSGSDHADSITAPPIKIVFGIPGEAAAVYYDCSRFNLPQQTSYFLLDTLVRELSTARQRLVALNEAGLSATAIWHSCLVPEAQGFVVLVDQVFPDSSTARIVRDSLQLQLDSLHRLIRIEKFIPSRR